MSKLDLLTFLLILSTVIALGVAIILTLDYYPLINSIK